MRSLLFSLLILAATPLPAADSRISEEAKECFDWFATLGFPDVKDATFAQVWTGDWCQSGSGARTSATLSGFVHDNSLFDFSVVGVDLIQRELTTSNRRAKPEDRIGYEKRSLTDYAKHRIELLRHPPKDDGGRFDAKLGQTAEVFFLAYACWRKGKTDLAQSLFDGARELGQSSNTDDDEPASMRICLEQELGHQAMWDAVLRCGGGGFDLREGGYSPDPVPRRELLARFRGIVKRYPASEHIERAKTTVGILERMVKEDDEHAAINDEALAKLPMEKQVRELIFRLRDQNGHQWSQPGWCDIFDMNDKGTTPAHRLVEIGYPAVPQLIEALTDERFSRSVGYHRDFCLSHTVLTIGDCAQQILPRISGRSFYVPRTPSSEMSSEQAQALEDTAAREGMSGSYGEFSFTNPRICDFALWSLHRIDPPAYAFSNKATRRRRDVERITAANIWRRANGKDLLPVPSLTLPVLPESEALRITTTRCEPAEASAELNKMVSRSKGAMFTNETIPRLLRWYIRTHGKVAGRFAIEAVRDDDLRGVSLNVRLRAGDYSQFGTQAWNWRYTVNVGDDNLINASGGGLVADDWHDFEDAVKKALRSRPKTPMVISASLGY